MEGTGLETQSQADELHKENMDKLQVLPITFLSFLIGLCQVRAVISYLHKEIG